VNKLLLTTLGMVIAVGCVLGCGSGEDEATSASLTKAQFIKQADAICARVSQQRPAALAAWKQTQNSAESSKQGSDLDAGLREVIAPSLRQEAEELEALTPPASDEAEVSRMVANLSEASNELGQEGVKKLTTPNLPQFKREAAGYGLKACRFP
jgi:hypothetical protein